jgi:hypothetical protein
MRAGVASSQRWHLRFRSCRERRLDKSVGACCSVQSKRESGKWSIWMRCEPLTGNDAQRNEQIVRHHIQTSQRSVQAVGTLIASQGIQNRHKNMILVQLVNLNQRHSPTSGDLPWAGPCLQRALWKRIQDHVSGATQPIAPSNLGSTTLDSPQQEAAMDALMEDAVLEEENENDASTEGAVVEEEK